MFYFSRVLFYQYLFVGLAFFAMPLSFNESDFAVFAAFSFLLVYILLILVTSNFIRLLIKPYIVSRPLSRHGRMWYLDRYSRLILLVVVCGAILVVYDRFFVRGVAFDANVRMMRYEWLSTLGGNLYGIIGNICLSFASLSLVNLILSDKHRTANSLAVLVNLAFYTVVNGGRSNILVFIFFGLTILSLRRLPFKFRSLGPWLILAALAVGGVELVTNASASLGSYSYKQQFIEGIEILGGSYDPQGIVTSDGYIFRFFYYIVYLFHSF